MFWLVGAGFEWISSDLASLIFFIFSFVCAPVVGGLAARHFGRQPGPWALGALFTFGIAVGVLGLLPPGSGNASLSRD